jgi:hypothetical protein
VERGTYAATDVSSSDDAIAASLYTSEWLRDHRYSLGKLEGMAPNATDLFDEAIRSRGIAERCAFDPGKWPGRLYAGVEALCKGIRDEIVRKVRTDRVVPEIFVGVVDDATFNACAFLHDGRYFIAVNYGALILMHALAHRIFSQPEFFPWAGDSTKENASRQFAPLSNNALTYMRAFLKDRGSIRPIDRNRGRCAELLLAIATEFLIGHEVAHIVCGHLGWWLKNYGSGESRLSEALAPAEKGALSLQALEMDADSFAMNLILLKTLAFASRREGYPNDDQRMVRTLEDGLQVALLCGMVMTGSFFFPCPTVDEWPRLDHPPTGVRLGANVLAADRSLRVAGYNELRAATSEKRDWIAQFVNLALRSIWKRIGHDDRDDELRTSFGPVGQRYLAKLLLEWGRIGPEVRAYSCIT